MLADESGTHAWTGLGRRATMRLLLLPPRRAQLGDLDDEGFQLLRGMLDYHPVRRVTAQQALQSPWFHATPAMCAPSELRLTRTGGGLDRSSNVVTDLLAKNVGRRFQTEKSAAHYSSRHTGATSRLAPKQLALHVTPGVGSVASERPRDGSSHLLDLRLTLSQGATRLGTSSWCAWRLGRRRATAAGRATRRQRAATGSSSGADMFHSMHHSKCMQPCVTGPSHACSKRMQ